MTIEDLFEAEAGLRIAAREYSSVEHSMCSIEVRRSRNRNLRVAARVYSKIADAFEAAVAATKTQDPRCCHLADCEEPAAGMMPDPCPNCGRYYVNDDNAVEQPRTVRS